MVVPRELVGRDGCSESVLECTTSDTVFGPIFTTDKFTLGKFLRSHPGDVRDIDNEAILTAFLEWVESNER